MSNFSEAINIIPLIRNANNVDGDKILNAM